MEKLIQLAQRISGEKLRRMVVEFLKNPTLSNESFKKYPREKIERAGAVFSAGGMPVERDVLNHTIALVEMCDRAADVVQTTYGLKLDRDTLLAAAILHDIAKLFEWKREKHGLEHTGVLLDHTMLGVAELYSRGFPEEVVHIIAAHFGEHGPTPPRNFEALIMHHIDNMLSIVESKMISPEDASQATQMLLLDDSAFMKMISAVSEVKKEEIGKAGDVTGAGKKGRAKPG
ncbi:MAG: HDIG domain-containing protein [Candidatus Aenigmarchaeota archaeon]|nr:HDIG domain-containing protein [Candidatus Aenigmarchaeota archaeon]